MKEVLIVTPLEYSKIFSDFKKRVPNAVTVTGTDFKKIMIQVGNSLIEPLDYYLGKK